jgi:hypothetical protein
MYVDLLIHFVFHFWQLEKQEMQKKNIASIVVLVLTDKTRIHLRFASVRTYTVFTTGFPRFLSIRRARDY